MKIIQFFCRSTLLVLLTNGNIFAATISSTATGGNWNTGSTWVGGIVPKISDDVVITTSSTVNLDIDTKYIASLTVQNGGSLITSINNSELNLTGPLINDGLLKLYVSAGITGKLFLRGNSNWSGNGDWELSQLSLNTFALEFDHALLINFHETIVGSPGSASLNMQNKRSDITFNFLSTGQNYTVSSEESRIYYGNIRVDMQGGTLSFYTYGNNPLLMNNINLAGDLHLENNSYLDINTCNILTINKNLSGTGQFKGGNSSDIVIDGIEAVPTFYMYPGSNFRNLTVNRPAGLILGNSITVRNTLTLNNFSTLFLPNSNGTPNNQILTLGESGAAGNLEGNGSLKASHLTFIKDMSDLHIFGNSPIVTLRFIQSGQGNELHDLEINKSAGIVVLDNNCDLKVRNDFTLTNGQLEIGANTLTLTGQIKDMNINGTLTGSPQSQLWIGNEVAEADATLFFTQTDASSRSLKTYQQSRNATISLGNMLEITEEVNLSVGTVANILQTNNNLLLCSTAALTARVANLGSSSILDSVYVQRFIKGGLAERRNYRLLSSPVYQQKTNGEPRYYFSRLQDDLLITGPGGSSNGFDSSPSNGSTILWYKEQSATAEKLHFPALQNISKNHSVAQSSLSAGNGYFIFFRGNRIDNLFNKTTPPFPVPEDVTVTFKGLLHQGDITVTGLEAPTGFIAHTVHGEPADGLNLLGNPYPSTIDWERSGTSTTNDIELTNIGNSIYMLDPVTRTYGTYQQGGLATGTASRYIASGQGFMVQATAADPKITFKETAKAHPQPTPLLMGLPHQMTPRQLIRMELKKDAINKDDIVLVFDREFKAEFDVGEDAMDPGGLNAQVDLSSLTFKGEILAINSLPEMENVSEVMLNVLTTASGNFEMHWDVSTVNEQFELVFADHLLQTSTNMRTGDQYPFVVNKADSATSGRNRFRIRIAKKKEEVLARNKPPVLMIYPNPAHDYIRTVFPSGYTHIKIQIIDAEGRHILHTRFQNKGADPYQLNTTKLKAGAYILLATDEKDGKLIYRDKFIIY